MTSQSIAIESPLEIRSPAARIGAGDRFTLMLTAGGLLAATVAYIAYDTAIRTQLRPDEFVPTDLVKPPIYYAAYAIQLVLLTAAGIFAIAGANLRRIERGFLVRFALFIAAATLMTVRGYAPADFLSTKLVDGTGLFPMIASTLIFLGAKRSNWVFLEKMFFACAALFSGLVLYRMLFLQTLTRQEGVANLGFSLNALLWPAAWIALRDYAPGSFGARVKFLPLLIYSAGSFFTQTRLNFTMVLGLLVLYMFIQRKRGAPQAGLWIGMALLAVWIALFTGIFLRTTRGLDRLQDVSTAFAERLDEDTRTEQVTAFFQDVSPQELILGRGSFGTWDWDGYEWRGGTDIGYLSLLFWGGLPLLLTYIAVHVKPCVSMLFNRAAGWRLAGAGVGALWGVRMLSSSYPATSLEYYCVLFCIGAAISRDRF
jgi:hypothetical protein